ncbi:ice-binding family protein [Planotetraspora silvatica]|nr:ice-binding family protein [Planotetraspora silvatica]
MAGLAALIAMGAVVAAPNVASAASPLRVELGGATRFAVLASSTVTNTVTPTVVSGDLGVSPGTAVTNFPPGMVTNGSTFVDAAPEAVSGQAGLTTAYNDAASRTPTIVGTELGGTIKPPGVYRSAAGDFQITTGAGPLTLDARGDPNAVFIFQTASTLVTAVSSQVLLINGAQACNVFWQVGSSATLGVTSTFVGNIMAQATITANTGATVIGRLLARTGAVNLDSNTVTRSDCAIPPNRTTTTTLTSSCAAGVPGRISFTATVRSTAGPIPPGSIAFSSDGASLGTVPLDANGRATLSYTNLSEGTHQIVAVYQGVLALNPSAALSNQRVGPGGVCPVVRKIVVVKKPQAVKHKDRDVAPAIHRKKDHTTLIVKAPHAVTGVSEDGWTLHQTPHFNHVRPRG